MAQSTETPLDELLLSEHEDWQDGPPNEIFKRLRSECPVHFTKEIKDFPDEDGYWSVTKADDVHTVSKDWQTYSSANGITGLRHSILPLELVQAMFIGMDPPKHDRLKALFQRGFTPKRIAEHEPAIREITREVLERARSERHLRARRRRRSAGRQPGDRELHGDPARGRRGLGAADELRPRLRRRRHQPRGQRRDHGARRPRDLRALRQADRRAAREPDRRPAQRPRPRRDRRQQARGARDRHGLLPARRRRQRQHEGDLLQRHAGDPRGPGAEAAAARRPGARSRWPSRRRCGCSRRSPTSPGRRRRTSS